MRHLCIKKHCSKALSLNAAQSAGAGWCKVKERLDICV